MKVESELYELKDRLWKAERKLEDLGYRHCDIPACNCNSYHRWSDPPEVATLRADNERLSGEVESLNDLLKTHKVIENFKSFEKCAKELADHKDALEKARVALDKCDCFCGVSESDGDRKLCDRCQGLATINTLLEKK